MLIFCYRPLPAPMFYMPWYPQFCRVGPGSILPPYRQQLCGSRSAIGYETGGAPEQLWAHLEKGTGFILGAHHSERILNELPNITITHLRAGFFYTNLYRFSRYDQRGCGFLASNYRGDDKLILVHPADIAAAATEEIENPSAGKKIRYVVSDEHTANEVAHIMEPQ